MRNLKRALSLALASIMLLGMMVVGTSAASYPDVDENDNVEAIEVLNAVKVMIGRQGNFEPDEAVNRHEMAVIMAKLVLGNETADNYVGTHPFTDVVSWADKYVAACYENGLVSGTSATTFSGNQPLTAVQAAAMMLRALGYKDLSKGANDWRAPVTAMANQIRLFNGVASNPSEKLNRNQVAQLALNTLKSPMVNLKDNTFDVTSGDGAIVISGGSREYIVLSSREAYAYAINDVESSGNSASGINGATVELGEHLYNGKLRLNNYDRDSFQRPARTWEYDGKEIGTYVKEELLRKTYTDKVTGRDLYELLTPNTIDKYDFVIAFDGETRSTVLSQVTGADQNPYFTSGNLVRTNTETIGRTGKGVLTEVYVDTSANNPTVYIVVINTYVAKAREDYNTKDGDIDLTVYGVDFVASNSVLVKDTTDSDNNSNNGKQPFTEVLSPAGEDFAMLKDAKKDDLFLVNVAGDEIQVIKKPEILSAVNLTAFSKGSYVITGGEKYEYNNTALYDPAVLDAYTSTNGGTVINLKDLTYNVVLDDYGYLIGVERIEDPTQYVFITGTDGGYSDLNSARTSMRAIFTDGTTDVIDVNMVKSDTTVRNTFRSMGPIINTWCTYTVDNDGVYTLRAVPTSIGTGKIAQWAQNAQNTANNGSTAGTRGTSSYTIDKGHVSLVANNGTNDIRVYGNDKTIYISAEMTIINAKTPVGGTADATNSLTSTGNGLTAGIGGAADKPYVVGANQSTNPRTAIINDVDSVTVGVANASIKAVSLLEADLEKELDNGERTSDTPNNLVFPKNEIYTLYNNDGVVIAAVVLGDDQGTSTKIATFTTNEPSAEEWVEETNARATSKGYWTWSREAIVDGEVVTLTETGDNLSQLAPWDSTYQTGHAKGDTAEIRFDADGHVRRADNLTKINGGTSANGEFRNGIYKYTTDIQSVEKSAESNDTVVLYADYTSGAKLVYSNGTLFRDNTATKGVYVNGANIIVANAKLKNNATGTPGVVADVDQYKTITRTYTGTDAMSDALNAMDDNFHGTLIIVVKDHVAQSVILNNTYGKKVNTGNTKPVEQDGGYPKVVAGGGTTYHVDYYDKDYKGGIIGQDGMTMTEIANAGAAAVSKFLGMPVDKAITLDGETVTAVVDTGTGLGTPVTINMHRVIKIFVDGQLNGYVEVDDTAATTYFGSSTQQGNTTKLLTAGSYLVNKYAKSTSADITAAGTAGSDAMSAILNDANKQEVDTYLYTAYSVTLDDTITGTYTEKANAATGNAGGNIATGTAHYIAKDTDITVKLTGKSDSKRYYFEASTSNPKVFGDSKVLAASGDVLTATYKVTSKDATTINAKAGFRILVNGQPVMVSDTTGDSWAVESLAAAIGLNDVSKWGNYLVKLPANPAATLIADAQAVETADRTNKLASGSAPTADGDKYEFGYYKVTVTTADAKITNAATETWSLVGCSGTVSAGTAFYAKSGAKVQCVYEETGTAADAKKATVTISVTGTNVDTVEAAVNTAFTVTKGAAADGVAVGTAVSADGSKVEIKTLKTDDPEDTIGVGKVTFTVTVGTKDISGMKVAEDND